MNYKALKEKAAVLAEVVKLTAELYSKPGMSEMQKGLLETHIGAGIWYLPNDSKVLFNGKISRAALEMLKTDPKTKLVEEHGKFPRKLAGKAL